MNIYINIEQAIRQHKAILHVDGDVQEADVRHAVRWVIRANPDLFWFVHQYHFNPKRQTISFLYQFSKERSELIQKSIDEVVAKDFQIDYVRSLNVYEQVAYVYKWLLKYCNYNLNSAYNQNIVSVFVHRNSVCAGYAKSAQYLFKLLGIESRLVFGRLNNDDNRDSRHCWNLVCIEGIWYHLDVSLGDSTFKKLLLESNPQTVLQYGGFNYNCFCVSTQEILRTHSIEDAISLPECDVCLEAENIKVLSQIILKERPGNVGCLLANNGSSADIFLCTKDKDVVLKHYRESFNSLCKEEVRYMNSVRGCRHVLYMNGTYTDAESNVIAIEQATPIVDLFVSSYYHTTLRDVLTMIKDIAEGWKECYNQGVLYRDIHICNIFKAKDGTYKLGDFGSCTFKQNLVSERVGSRWFMAPETFLAGQFDEQSAVFSITAVLYFILNGLRPPFADNCNEPESICENTKEKVLQVPLLLNTFPKNLSELIMNKMIIKGCAYNQAKRLNSIDSLLTEINLLLDEDARRNGDIDADELSNTLLLNAVELENGEDGKFINGETVEQFAMTMSLSGTAKPDYTYTPCQSVKEVNSLLCFKDKLYSLFSPDKRKGQLVYSSVFAPAEIKRKSHMLTQVYLHSLKDTAKVINLAMEVQQDAVRRDYIPLQCKLKKDDNVDVTLCVYGEELLKSEKKSIIWQGVFTKCCFDYLVPKDIDVDELSCMVLLTINDIPVGEMRFVTYIVDEPRKVNSEIVSHRYNKVFISYSHQDEVKVNYLHEGLKLGKVEHFFDRNYLKAGDVFPQVIADYINSADLFILCWSENASRSEYVQKERLLALKRAYPQIKPQKNAKLSIYPISIEPYADLPADMKESYHFGTL